MKRTIIALAVCLTVLAGCGNGKLSGEKETLTIGVPCTFSSLQIDGYAHFVTSSTAKVVTVTADKNIVNLVKVKGTEKKLKIDVSNKRLKALGNEAVQIELPYSMKLSNVKMDGSSVFEIPELLLAPDSKFDTKGSNYIKGVLTFDNLIINSEGADIYDIDANGSTLKLTANGSSSFGSEAIPLLVGEITLDLKGACVAYIEAPGKCVGTVDGSCEVYAHGDHDYHKIKTLAAAKVMVY